MSKSSAEILGECWIELDYKYQLIARDYKLSAAQKLQYLHNIGRDTQKFYMNYVQTYAILFQQAVHVISQECQLSGQAGP